MLTMNNADDMSKMKNYYRTSDMLNLIYFFPDLSPIKDLTVVESIEDYQNNKEYIDSLASSRTDTIKGKALFNIEVPSTNNLYYETIKRVKEKDDDGVLIAFNTKNKPSERYERLAGISVGVDLYNDVIIDAVSKGFDGREVSKSICCHERYFIPWFDLRKINVSNFKNYQTYQISNEEYQMTREERINFLSSVGLDKMIFEKYIPEKYQEIPDIVWKSVIVNLLKKLEKQEEILEALNFTNFAISGHTEGDNFSPWQMFDKTRYTSLIRRK